MNKNSEEVAAAFGYMTQDEVAALKLLAKMNPGLKFPTFVNVGAGSGTSTLALAEARKDARIVEVDVSRGGPLGGLENTRVALEEAGIDLDNVWQILGRSHDIAARWNNYDPDRPIHLIFIDDGHMEQDVRGDIQLWSANFHDGTIVVFHDYGAAVWPAVKKVVDELMARHTKILHVGSLVAFRWRITP